VLFCPPFDVYPTYTSGLVGVKTFDVSLETQTANITTEPTVSYDTVLAAIKKTGKTVNSGEADGQTMTV
jgi:copper chaperone